MPAGNQEIEQRSVLLVSELKKVQEKLGHGYLSAFPEEHFDRLQSLQVGCSMSSPGLLFSSGLQEGVAEDMVRSTSSQNGAMALSNPWNASKSPNK